MAHHQRGLRAELAAILSVDQFTLEELVAEPSPPGESTSNRLSNLLVHALQHAIEARAVHAFLPALLQRLLGFAPGTGWLETASALPSRDRDALLSLVLPHGALHSFCMRAGGTPFEFPVRNLPTHVRTALVPDSESDEECDEYPDSLLVPTLRPHLGADTEFVVLDCLTYFQLCLVAAPATKFATDGLAEGTSAVTMKRLKRSTSLPSTRALYNLVIAAYLAHAAPAPFLSPADAPLLVRAALDMLPAAAAPSAAAADALSILLLHGVPPAWLFPTLPRLISSAAHPAALSALLRLLALAAAPWRAPVRTAARAALFSKQKKAATKYNQANTPRQAAPVPHVLAAAHRAPAPDTPPAEVRSTSRTTLAPVAVDAVARAASLRIAAAPDGLRSLAMLTDALTALRLPPNAAATAYRSDELVLCLDSIRHAAASPDAAKGLSKWERAGFLPALATALGVPYPTGTLFPSRRSRSPPTRRPASSPTPPLRDRITNLFGWPSRDTITTNNNNASDKSNNIYNNSARRLTDAPFLGSVWDRPLASSEVPALVAAAYWLALRLTPHLGYTPDIRFLGSLWFSVFVLAAAAAIKAIQARVWDWPVLRWLFFFRWALVKRAE